MDENRDEEPDEWIIDSALSEWKLHVALYLYRDLNISLSSDDYWTWLELAWDYYDYDTLMYLYKRNQYSLDELSNTSDTIMSVLEYDFKKLFRKIEKQNIVRTFILKKIVYHPNSSYIKRLVNNFD